MSPVRPLPTDRPVLAWYGDDFTGAAAVMEVLTFAGLDAVLFLATPTPEDLARFPEARAIGLAGDARARPPDWMKRHLPGIFGALRATGAPLLHYKVCSTLDSAPHIGSIGCAADLAMGETGWAPLAARRPRDRPLAGLRQPLCPRRHRDQPPRPSPHHVGPPGHADARERRAPPSRGPDRPAPRARRSRRSQGRPGCCPPRRRHRRGRCRSSPSTWSTPKPSPRSAG